MAISQMMSGTPVLLGDNTIPGVKMPDKLKKAYPKILKAVKDFGCDPYDTIVELLTYDEISEIASYGGFPVRYSHWSHGMEYEEMSRGYEFGMHKIYEMVINTNPCYLYCLDSNPFIDHVTVIAHALGHCDFFKNNIWFGATTRNALNEFANHGTRVRRYMERWGVEPVVQFLDWLLSIDDLIDPRQAWAKRKAQVKNFQDTKNTYNPRRLKLPENDGEKQYWMEDVLNPKPFIDKERKRILAQQTADSLEIYGGGQRDIMGYLLQHAPLTMWQADIASMIYREAQYFYPQRQTKMLNEGWASFVDYNIMARQQWAEGEGIVHYAEHKAGVLGGKYSMNPYAVGFKLMMHIEDKWNKGRFGKEYENCNDAEEKKNWDTKAGLGHEKVLELRKFYNDVMAIDEFVDQEFIDKFELYYYQKVTRPNGTIEYVIVSRDAKDVRAKLLEKYSNGGRPDISLEDPNFGGKQIFFMQHRWDGRLLSRSYAQETLKALWNIWTRGGHMKRPVALATKNKDEKEIVYVCTGTGEKDNYVLNRKEFEEQFA